MNWFNTIIVSIGAMFSSLLGMSHTATTTIPTSPAPIQQAAKTPQVSDEQSVINTVSAMLNAERNAATFQDAENAVTDYTSQVAIQQFQAGISKVPASSLSSMQGYILQVDHAYPNPSSLQFSVMITGDMATATAALPTTTSNSPQTINGTPVGTITATYQNSITIPLQKENGQWKVNKIILVSKGISAKTTTNPIAPSSYYFNFILPDGKNDQLRIGQSFPITWEVEPVTASRANVVIDIVEYRVINGNRGSGHTIVSGLTASQAGCASVSICRYTWQPTVNSPSDQIGISIHSASSGSINPTTFSPLFSVQ